MQNKSNCTGGCYCGKIRYEIQQGLERNVLCHCENCRKVSGGIAVAWTIIESGNFQYTLGNPKTYLSGTGATWSFCPDCGTTLTYRGADYDKQLDVTFVSLDDHGTRTPDMDANQSERLDWVALAKH